VAISVVIVRVRKPLLPGVAGGATGSHAVVVVSPGSQAAPAMPGGGTASVERPHEAQPEGVAGTGSPEQNTAEAGSESGAAQIVRDDDMLANFDVLSELPAQPDGAQLSN